MPSGVPPWNIGVISDATNHSAVKNALVYADNVVWEPFEIAYGDESSQPYKSFSESWLKFHPEAEKCGLASCVTSEGFIVFLGRRPKIDEVLPWIERRVEKLQTCKSIIFPESIALPLTKWNTYQATQALQSAVSCLLLPDLSSLPLEAIAELRQRLSPTLEPMRAELLRLTEDLRKLVSDETDAEIISAEASNLVATRVEPVVREASHRARELSQKKWRKFYEGVAKTFGLVGAAYINPKLIAKAVQQTLETAALTVSDIEDKRPGPKMTAQFVLEARSFIAERSPER